MPSEVELLNGVRPVDPRQDRPVRLPLSQTALMAGGDRFERHRQPWTSAEIQKLHVLAKKGMALKAIAKALTRSEESVRDRAKADGLGIAKLR